jgi:DNA-binding response OmpR family regulator
MVPAEGSGLGLLPILVVEGGASATATTSALRGKSRLELFVVDALTPRWIMFAQRLAGTVIVGAPDTMAALTHAITAGVQGPILMVLENPAPSESNYLLAAGCTACFEAPVSPAEIERLVGIVAAHGSVARVDPTLRITLDPIGRTVNRGDRRERLSQREFAVLYALSLSEGRPVSADDLLARVWGGEMDHDATRESLEYYVSQVRRKLGRLGLRDAIVTLREFGYALAPSKATAGVLKVPGAG